MVINSLGNGGSTLRLFCLPLVLGAKEREEEGWGEGGETVKGRGRQGDKA